MEYGCIGEKLGHSFSKIIHNKLADYNYELKEIPKENLKEFICKRDFKAINVTIPYKQDVIPFLDEISDTAKSIGAVNTIVNKNGKLFGFNTDFKGLEALILKNGIEVQNKKVLILGSGGTSKTAFAVAKHLKAKEIYRVSRNATNTLISYEDAKKLHSDAEIIINTTPCGMYPNIGVSAVNIGNFRNLEGVVDAVYNPLNSALVLDAKSRGIKAVGGLYMLVAQAVFACELFLDTELDKSEIDRIFGEIFSSKQNLVLIGMPASGKTTIGKLLAEKMQKEFIDTDELIVKKAGKTIPEIFSESGEKGFREIESQVIAEASALQGMIIATGGGAVLNSKNTELLKGNGKIIFLDRDLEKLVTTPDRPLSSNREDLQKRYNERYPIYLKCADLTLKNNGQIDDIIKEVLKNENFGN